VVTLEARNDDLKAVVAGIARAMQHRGLVGTAAAQPGADAAPAPTPPATAPRWQARALAPISIGAAIATALALALWLWPSTLEESAPPRKDVDLPGAQQPGAAVPPPNRPPAADAPVKPGSPLPRDRATPPANAIEEPDPGKSQPVEAEPPPPANDQPPPGDPGNAAPSSPVDPEPPAPSPVPKAPSERFADWVGQVEKAADYDRADAMLRCLGSTTARSRRFDRLHDILRRPSSEELGRLPRCLAANPLPAR